MNRTATAWLSSSPALCQFRYQECFLGCNRNSSNQTSDGDWWRMSDVQTEEWRPKANDPNSPHQKLVPEAHRRLAIKWQRRRGSCNFVNVKWKVTNENIIYFSLKTLLWFWCNSTLVCSRTDENAIHIMQLISVSFFLYIHFITPLK